MHARILALVTVACLCAAPAFAQQQPLRLEIRGGRVTLDAQNVPLRVVLNEWARVGGTKFVNVERVTAAPVTLTLTGVSERQALDILLRNVAGYVLGARQTTSTAASDIDRVMILATSAAPPRSAQPVAANPGVRVVNPPRAFVQPGFDPGDQDAEPDFEQPQAQPGIRRPIVMPPGMRLPPSGDGEFIPAQEQPVEPEGLNQPRPVQTSPGNPFGIPAGSSGRPGEITPVQPRQQEPQMQGPFVPDAD